MTPDLVKVAVDLCRSLGEGDGAVHEPQWRCSTELEDFTEVSHSLLR